MSKPASVHEVELRIGELRNAKQSIIYIGIFWFGIVCAAAFFQASEVALTMLSLTLLALMWVGYQVGNQIETILCAQEFAEKSDDEIDWRSVRLAIEEPVWRFVLG